jgi:hypothetical protein
MSIPAGNLRFEELRLVGAFGIEQKLEVDLLPGLRQILPLLLPHIAVQLQGAATGNSQRE